MNTELAPYVSANANENVTLQQAHACENMWNALGVSTNGIQAQTDSPGLPQLDERGLLNLGALQTDKLFLSILIYGDSLKSVQVADTLRMMTGNQDPVWGITGAFNLAFGPYAGNNMAPAAILRLQATRDGLNKWLQGLLS